MSQQFTKLEDESIVLSEAFACGALATVRFYRSDDQSECLRLEVIDKSDDQDTGDARIHIFPEDLDTIIAFLERVKVVLARIADEE